MNPVLVYILSFLLISSICLNKAEAQRSSAKKSGKYTRVGSEAAGNKEGDLRPHEGDKGLECPSNHEKGSFLPNPYKYEKRLFRIDYNNVDKYKNRLTPGQYMRIKQNKRFYINVFPTHRNHVFPEKYYKATEKNLKTCKLNKNDIMIGFNGGLPFPYPKNGLEAIWNVKQQWTGDDFVAREEVRRVVSPSGRIKKEIWQTKGLNYDNTRLERKLPNPDKITRKLIAFYTYPADVSGTALLTIQYMDDRFDDTWVYLPTLRRVRRAPSLTRGGQMDGEYTMDELGYGFRGAANDWNWKLLGKKEIYIPVNCYDMWEIGGTDEDECWPRDINPKRIRHELRRVWVIEGTTKGDTSHPYIKRIEFVDEDSWYPIIGDRYDRRGNLWRMCIFYTFFDYCQTYRAVVSHMYLNLESGRYDLRGGGRTEKTRLAVINTGLSPKEFTVQALRRGGR